ncbi:uncharacterized protein EI97DRAFT_430292 [Westerdykella ornata]|uniref:HTH La-type RNA-binding domain-containing protein n=1 Tax=Westerdykella ornata TaxID=318751 RepID=A0A6A6JS29_WESOR|nr:uncharacterized protein EI97DRAFT_430292 [Westerdykella ornata]KAF2279197.1 hypothetical protein EI97DRAFT_430292 [Westerdykella ornata]
MSDAVADAPVADKVDAPAEVTSERPEPKNESAEAQNTSDPTETDPEGRVDASDSKDAESEEAPHGAKADGATEPAKGDDETKKWRDERRNGSRNDPRPVRGRGRGGKSQNMYNRKSKSNEFQDLPETDDPVLIRQQVEFYLSDHNLCTDKHMFEEIKGAQNLPVPIKHLHTFKRMRRFQPYSAIVAALRDSKLVEVVDTARFSGTGNEGVKRKHPIEIVKRDDDGDRELSVEEQFDRLFHRSRNQLDASVYVKNFGDPAEAGQIELEMFFKQYGAIMVRKRRTEDGEWKGSVFVEFPDEETQKQFLALDPKPVYKGNELIIMSKKDYSLKKCKEKGITPTWAVDEQDSRNRDGPKGRFQDRRGGRGRGRGGRGRGGGRGAHNDRNDWNGRRDDFQKSKEFSGEKSNKRKAENEGAAEVEPEKREEKKAKVEIKEDA